MRKTLIITHMLIAMMTPAAAQSATPEQRAAVETACKADVTKLCPDVQPGGGRIAVCLRQNEKQVSTQCREAVAKLRAAR
jgi:hypothetical protein